MGKKVYIACTLASPQAYSTFLNVDNAKVPTVEKVININGGHNVANKNLITPHGVITEISEEDYAILKEIKGYQVHEKNGFVKMLKQNPRSSEKAVSDLNQDDPSRPVTPGDYEAEGKEAPKTGEDVAV